MLRPLSFLLTLLVVTAATVAQQAVSLVVSGMPKKAPLTVTAQHDGETLEVRFDLKKSWHVYTRDTGGGQPVAVKITGGAFAANGKLVLPRDHDGQVEGQATFKLPLRRVAEGTSLQAQVDFMVCDPLECLPPIRLQLATAAEAAPLRVLLVAVDTEERTQRIEAFLKARGFTTGVTTYAQVRAEDCEKWDVVLADSPTFRNVKGQTGNARKFPLTKTPIVAVGFLGTELIEGQKVAMTSGYI
ncbi:MAG: hypothetical protein KDC48_12700 [Planctomycetes bacterium]|nr:hypothetical protein [Planctomycetota bacterium]